MLSRPSSCVIYNDWILGLDTEFIGHTIYNTWLQFTVALSPILNYSLHITISIS
jgi:hypothetical protein